MPTVMTHAVVGLALGSLTPFRRRGWLFWVTSAVLPMLPDLDVLGLYFFGIRFYSMWGHRGISHALVGALVIGAIAALLVHRRVGVGLGPLTVYFTLLTASHGILDAFTNGGPGVAFFAPFDDTRYFFPWRPVPVSPFWRKLLQRAGMARVDGGAPADLAAGGDRGDGGGDRPPSLRVTSAP
jgi:inner membrane protein